MQYRMDGFYRSSYKDSWFLNVLPSLNRFHISLSAENPWVLQGCWSAVSSARSAHGVGETFAPHCIGAQHKPKVSARIRKRLVKLLLREACLLLCGSVWNPEISEDAKVHRNTV